MSSVSFLDSLERRFASSSDCYLCRSFYIHSNSFDKPYLIPMIIITHSGIILFSTLDDFGPLVQTNKIATDISACFQENFKIPYQQVYQYVIEDGLDKERYIAVFSGDNYEITEEDILKKIERLLPTPGIFDDTKYEDLKKAAIGCQATCVKAIKKTDSDGNEYINKGGKWLAFTEDDPDNAFKNLLYTGLFGGHCFHDKKFVAGVFYLFTAGGFGIFWLMDVFLMLAGGRRGSKGKIYKPLNNKKKCLKRFFLFLPVAIILVVLNIWVQIKMCQFIAPEFYQSFANLGNNSSSMVQSLISNI